MRKKIIPQSVLEKEANASEVPDSPNFVDSDRGESERSRFSNGKSLPRNTPIGNRNLWKPIGRFFAGPYRLTRKTIVIRSSRWPVRRVLKGAVQNTSTAQPKVLFLSWRLPSPESIATMKDGSGALSSWRSVWNCAVGFFLFSRLVSHVVWPASPDRALSLTASPFPGLASLLSS